MSAAIQIPFDGRMEDGSFDSGIRTMADYLAIAKERWKVGLATFIPVVLLATLFGLLQSDRYEAEATVLLRTGSSQQLFPSAGSADAEFERDQLAELEYVGSDDFLNLVGADDVVEITAPENSNVLLFTAEAGTAADAIGRANDWAAQYVSARQSLEVDANEVARASLSDAIADLERQKADILEPLRPLDAALERATDPDTISRLTTQRVALLQTFADQLLPIEAELRDSADQLAQFTSVSRFLDRGNMSARLTSAADVAVKVAPRPLQMLIIGSLLGLVLAVGAILIADSINSKISRASDIERGRFTMPVLAQVPDNGRPVKKLDEASNAVLEGIEGLATAFAAITRASDAKTVVVTSARQGEGKSTTAGLFAQRAALQGSKVLLIDADVRRPTQHLLHGIGNDDGLTEALSSGTIPQIHEVRSPTGHGGFHLVTSGGWVENPAGLMRSDLAGRVFDAIAKPYDLVIIDSPPVLAVTDAQALASVVADVAVVVARVNYSRRSEVAEAAELIELAGGKVAGAVLVGSKPRLGYYDY